MVLRSFWIALRMLVATAVLTGVLYPALVTLVARFAFAHRSEGSLIERDGIVIGSELIGQPFSSPRYFRGRPSATATPYDAASSSGSNLGPLNPDLREAVEERIAALRASDPAQPAPIPVDLVTASGSGLDPHVSPAAALWQVPRVARERGWDEQVVRDLVDRHVEGRTFGLLGEPRVNVLRLNLALDAER
jgi:potassium-transporting ATPase KdpC subunit